MAVIYHGIGSLVGLRAVSRSQRTASPLRGLKRLTFKPMGMQITQTGSATNGANANGATATLPGTTIPEIRIPDAIPGVLPPPKAFESALNLGAAKALLPSTKIFQLAVMAGAYIAFGAFLALSVGGACPGLAATNPGLQKIISGSFGLPFGLLMVLLCGGELFTGNAALVTVALNQGRATWRQLAKSWAVSYAGNVIGAGLLVAAVLGSGLLAGAAAPLAAAVAKTSLTFTEAFFRGLLCNWLVCVAIWQATAATTLSGKALGVYFPISAFVALGLEHCVANMFIIPVGIALGAPVTPADFLTRNLLPVTLGNIVGGALCVGLAHCAIFGSRGAAK